MPSAPAPRTLAPRGPRRDAPSPVADTFRAAAEALGSAFAASPAGADSAPDALLHATLAVAYRVAAVRVVAGRVPALAAWAPDESAWPQVAAALTSEGPLGALGLAAVVPSALFALGPDPLAHALLAADVPTAALRAFLAALPAPPCPADLSADPLGLAAAHEALLARVPTRAGGGLALADPGAGRRAAGSFYTPAPVVSWLLDAALAPALAEGPLPRVLDPTCGAGAFLVAAGRRLRARAPAAEALACLHGVDLDPLAVLLCRLALWVDAVGPDTPADERAALAARVVVNVRRGDALLGADAALVGAGVPDGAYAASAEGGDRAARARWRAQNRAERAARPLAVSEAPAPALFPPRAPAGPPDAPGAARDAWCAAFLWPADGAAGPPPTTDTVRRLAAGHPIAAHTAAEIGALAVRHGFLHWDTAFPEVAARGGFDVVLGNPPFLNQLERDTVAPRAAAALLRARFGDTLRAYTDTAALLLLQGARLLRPGGRLGMVAPQSVLVAQDARAVRDALTALAPLTHVWWAGAHVFAGASVFVTGLALRRPDSARPAEPVVIRRAHGPRFDTLPNADSALLHAETWTPLVADALGAPALALRPAGRLGEIARATADFRDEYYGLLPFVVDRRDADEARFPRLLLTGHIDPATSTWGERPVRFGRRAWANPRVDLSALDAEGSLAAWAAARRTPKILVATQTRTIEAVADPAGQWLTTTPTISVFPADGAFWRVAAVLLGPVGAAWALANYGAAALAVGAIKLSAGQLEKLPLPADAAAWDEAAARVAAAHAAAHAAARRALLVEAAGLSVRAYGQDAGLVAWWRDRLPPAAR